MYIQEESINIAQLSVLQHVTNIGTPVVNL